MGVLLCHYEGKQAHIHSPPERFVPKGYRTLRQAQHSQKYRNTADRFSVFLRMAGERDLQRTAGLYSAFHLEMTCGDGNLPFCCSRQRRKRNNALQTTQTLDGRRKTTQQPKSAMPICRQSDTRGKMLKRLVRPSSGVGRPLGKSMYAENNAYERTR